MTLLRFDVPLRNPDLQSIDIPIEVRTSKMALVAEVTASRGLDVDEGRYVITAKLPAGQTITEVVDVKGGVFNVTLAPEEDQAPAEAWEETGTYFASQRAQKSMVPPRQRAARRAARDSASVLESMLPEGPSLVPQATLRFFAGNVLAGRAQPVGVVPERHSSTDEVAELVIAPSEHRLVQYADAARTPINIALPVSQQQGCSIVVRRESNRYWVEVYPRHQHANLLLGYAQNRFAQSEAALAETLVFEKFEDPIAAAVGAYSLLRVGRLDQLHEWTANLMNYFPLADGAAAHGEHCARRGKHLQALNAFIEMTNRGLPVFSEGLRFAHERLTFYADPTHDLPPNDVRRARIALDRIRPFVRRVDFKRSITTYVGADPNRPGSPATSVPEGMDVAPLFA